MANTICLKDLFLGKTDGAVEAKEDNFQELFYDPYNKYDELMSGKDKFLVLGNKGTGKTYLANYIEAKATEKECVHIIGENDFTICKLNAVSQEDLNDELANAFCKWFMLDRLAHSIIDKCPVRAGWIPTSNVFKLRKFISNYENDDAYKIVKRIVESSREKQQNSEIIFSVESQGGKASNAQKSGSTYTIEEEKKKFFELIPAYEKKVFQAIDKHLKYTIIVDDLDEMINGKDSESRDRVIINLIKIAREYNLSKQSNNVKFIILLRTDILNDLQAKYSNLSKTTTSCAVELYWLFDNTSIERYNHPLMSMIFHKIRSKASEYSGMSNGELYKLLFPEPIDNKRPLDYLLDYGFGRPRDFVTFLSCAQTECPDQRAFIPHVLKEARKSYSSDFYDELLNQSAYYGNSEFAVQCFQLLGSVKRPSFNYEEIDTIYKNSRDYYKDIKSTDDALKFLYRIGAIGNSWKGRNAKKSKFGWSYKKDAMNEVDLSKKFTIHYGLRKKFSMD